MNLLNANEYKAIDNNVKAIEHSSSNNHARQKCSNCAVSKKINWLEAKIFEN